MIAPLLRLIAGRPVPADVPTGVVVLRGRWIPVIGGHLSGFGRAAAAVTLGRTIVVHPSAVLTPRLIRHELAHVRQWASRGACFPILYVWQHIRNGYHDNPFEVEARLAEADESGPDRLA